MRPFPFVNDWRKGCWVARVTGQHPQYVFDREFCRGAPVKSAGIVRYSLSDLGGPGWIVAKDMRGIRSLVAVTEIGFEDMGEVTSGGVLAVFVAGLPGADGAWDGRRCECEAPIIGGGETCDRCADELDRAAIVRGHLAAMPDEEAF